MSLGSKDLKFQSLHSKVLRFWTWKFQGLYAKALRFYGSRFF